MVFCAYCGQNFKRKEHLERHLPSHTNVKPYKCDSCQLSFARKDLLQKHHSTYHEIHDPMNPKSAQPLASNRTPIACIHCATAKAGCDKKVPCSRCADKNLPCAPRFARRSSKGHRTVSLESVPSYNTLNIRASTETGSAGEACNDRGSPLPQNHNQSDPMIWSSPHEHHAEPDSAFSNSGLDMVQLPEESFGRVNDYLKNNYFDPRENEFENMNLNLWSSGMLDVDMCGGGNLDFQNNMTMFWVPENTSVHNAPLPSPPQSSANSRINSITTEWHPQGDSSFQGHANQSSQRQNGGVPELEIVIASEESWPLARCNPRIFSGCCPRTAIIHLQMFQNCSRLEDSWSSMNDMMTPSELEANDSPFAIVSLNTSTRDKIIAFAQSFFLKALMTHQSGANHFAAGMGQTKPGGPAFFTLPPSNVLESLLRCSRQSLSPYYTLIHGTALDPNELMLDNDTSTLLFLLMMAQGASTVPKSEARYLAAGLTETCRISLFDVIEKNVELSADPSVLKSALLFTLLGAWGGDAWHIKQAMGQRGMYLAMLRHSGMLEPMSPTSSDFDESTDLNLRWADWLRREHINRLVYNWAMIDQELSLFHDTSPILSITELQTPLPGSERSWRAQKPSEWYEVLRQTYGNPRTSDFHSATEPQEGCSLSHLFQDLLRDELNVKNRQLSPLSLKLLLHPLQSLVCHLGQLLSCFYGMHDKQHTTRPLTTASTMMRIEEVQSYLQRWYELCMNNIRANPDCLISNGSLILYHLINLNIVSYFPEVERFSRQEGLDSMSRQSALHSKRFLYQSEKAVFHSGQVLRLIGCMPQAGRPPWWSAAIYRATMILWIEGQSRTYTDTETPDRGLLLMVNAITPEDPACKAYLNNLYGIPAILQRDGSCAKLSNPNDVLTYGVMLLDEGTPTRFSDGIRRKLQKLSHNWKSS